MLIHHVKGGGIEWGDPSPGAEIPMIRVTLSNGTVNEYLEGITVEEVVTDDLGRRHGCVAASIDGALADLGTELHADCVIEGIHGSTDEGMHVLRHSAAHLLAHAVTSLFPEAKPTIGPAIDRGFYYDFAMDPIDDGDLKRIEKKMQELARRNLIVTREECGFGAQGSLR